MSNKSNKSQSRKPSSENSDNTQDRLEEELKAPPEHKKAELVPEEQLATEAKSREKKNNLF